MLATEITYCGTNSLVLCDLKCNKAWGVTCRPVVHFTDMEYDDFAFLADDELGEAPADPGTYEGGHGKPKQKPDRHNKWCVRQCERSVIFDFDHKNAPQDYSNRVYNQPWRHK